MVKRIVDTKFWSNMEVLDNYSVEDKFFALYLMTNAKSTQVGIYPLPKKVISFETGFTTEAIQVLLDRFSSKYEQIIYSEETQEITLLRSLEYSIIKGGKPVSDLLERELRTIQDGQLILATYETMKGFWESSKRRFDQIIQHVFEVELTTRELLSLQNENHNHNHNDKDNDNHNKNDNEGSYSTIRRPEKNSNRGTNRELLINTDCLLPEEQAHLTNYLGFLRYHNPSFDRPVATDEILEVFYEELIGDLTASVKDKIKAWDLQLPKSLIVEAMVRSTDKYRPTAYLNTVIDNWLEQDVTNLHDLSRLDREFNRSYQ